MLDELKVLNLYNNYLNIEKRNKYRIFSNINLIKCSKCVLGFSNPNEVKSLTRPIMPNATVNIIKPNILRTFKIKSPNIYFNLLYKILNKFSLIIKNQTFLL